MSQRPPSVTDEEEEEPYLSPDEEGGVHTPSWRDRGGTTDARVSEVLRGYFGRHEAGADSSPLQVYGHTFL